MDWTKIMGGYRWGQWKYMKDEIGRWCLYNFDAVQRYGIADFEYAKTWAAQLSNENGVYLPKHGRA